MLPTAPRLRQARLAAVLQASVVALLAAGIVWLAQAPLAVLAISTLGAAGLTWWLAWRPWQRRIAALKHGLSEDDQQELLRSISWVRDLIDADRQRFFELVAIFLAEIPIVSVGIASTRRDHLLVAASAIIPILGFPAWEYDGLVKVLLRPHAFDATFSAGQMDPLAASGMVADGGLFNGTVILSLPDLREAYADDHDGLNVGIHEFAHLVDRATGRIDGLPPLPRQLLEPWLALVRTGLQQRGRHRALRQYGYTNPQEFFAVATEAYFEQPGKLRHKAPELHALLEKLYGKRRKRKPTVDSRPQ